jgi:1,4-dihydroxy-2-naphthoyl-CoA hydrolase
MDSTAIVAARMGLPPLRIPPEETFDALYGMSRFDITEESARGEVVVRREIMQPWGLVHGGIYASMAESLASWATALAVAHDGNLVMGMSNNTSFLRPISEGKIHALATRRHRGRSTWVWDVDISDDAGRLCASSRVTIAVRPYEGGDASV